MVLQAAPANASVWGFAPPGSVVSLQLEPAPSSSAQHATSVRAKAADDGTWKAFLPRVPAGSTSYTLTATKATETLQLHDVLRAAGRAKRKQRCARKRGDRGCSLDKAPAPPSAALF